MEPVAPDAVVGQYPGTLRRTEALESSLSAVSWAAVAGGGFVAAALALILVALGAGFGFSAVSPWAGIGASAKAIGVAAIAWIVFMQVASSALGGYVAGRLRTKWVGVHTDEVYFRDTAHGFLVWAVGLVIGAALLGSAAKSLVGTAAEVGAGAAATAATATAAVGGGAAANAMQGGGLGRADGNAYFVDTLFRNDRAGGVGADTTGAGASATGAAPSNASGGSTSQGADANTRAEVSRIFANALTGTEFPAADKTYLTQLVSQRTGFSQADADRRVSTVISQAQQAKVKAQEAADEARKAATHLAFWTFFALLCGAFAASFAATIGGRHRDNVVRV
jgi:hypothetical protein